MTALAAPVEFNGHFYEVIEAPNITWAAANDLANASMFEGTPGHLATITSLAEDEFVESIRGGLSPAEAWVGGSTQSSCAPIPGCGWTWINGEGAISTPQVPLSSYANWLVDEPNNQGGEELHLGVGLGGAFGWNDEGRISNIGGYVIEYDTPLDAGECVSEGEGCPLATGAILTFPPSVQLEPDAQIDVRRFEFTDDLSACGQAQRVLFGDATDPLDEIPDVIIPAYLCGSPKFLVVAAETSGVVIPDGTIIVENQTSDVFPDNIYDCQGPLAPDVMIPELHPDDPQNRDVMAWQSTDLTEMLENDLGATNSFPGTVGEFTFECGSSRGKTRSASYFFVGLHIDFGPGYELTANAAGNHDMFVALTRYKLVLLQAAVLESKVALNGDFFQKIGFRTLKKLVRIALRLHDRGRYSAALYVLQVFEVVVDSLNYDTIAGENYRGEHLMRESNAQFMYTDKVIPNAP